MNSRDLVFIDVETTGLDPEKHDIIEIAWIITSADAERIKERYTMRMLPTRPENAEPKALEINGYSEAKWRASELAQPNEVAKAVAAATADRILVGQNVSFDEGFIKALLKRFEITPRWRYHKVDTVALAWPALSEGSLERASLEKLCAYFSIPQPVKHEAMADVMSCYNVYRAMMRKYAPLFH